MNHNHKNTITLEYDLNLLKTISFLFVILISLESDGQHLNCYDSDKALSVIDEERINEVIKGRIENKNFRNDERDTIIINPIILRKSDGSDPSISLEQLDLAINAANEYFKFTNIYFQYCGNPKYLDDDIYYNLTIEEGHSLNDLMHVPNAINIYVVETISQAFPDGTVSLFCGIASFPKPETDSRYLLLDGACMSDETLLAHELGHFYGLYHTHETAFGDEFVNRENCEIAGDFLCDTPADPLLHGSNVVSCRYFGSEVDPIGDQYRPDTKNIMSYAPQDCRSKFSWQQIIRMRDIHMNENSYLLKTCDFPDFTIKIDTLFAAFRPNQEIELPLVIYNLGSKKLAGLRLDAYLSDEPGKRMNLIENDTILFPENQSQLNLKMKIKLPVDLPETTQYITVVLDESDQHKELDEENNSATLAYKVDYGNLKDVTIYPNPASDRTKVFLRNETMKGEVLIDLFDTNGRLVLRETRIKTYDTFQAEINTAFLLPGIYFISVRVEDSEPYQLRLLKI
ncbi:MAG: T9SS type A sorting domain-containing protein [Saprospiraceae bacterium]|nr:T9SS type A sorting domain-containing protein [Saprospiraceae bacterium]